MCSSQWFKRAWYCTFVRNLPTKQHVKPDIYWFFIFQQQFCSLFRRNKPVKEYLTFLFSNFSNVHDGRTALIRTNTCLFFEWRNHKNIILLYDVHKGTLQLPSKNHMPRESSIFVLQTLNFEYISAILQCIWVIKCVNIHCLSIESKCFQVRIRTLRYEMPYTYNRQ